MEGRELLAQFCSQLLLYSNWRQNFVVSVELCTTVDFLWFNATLTYRYTDSNIKTKLQATLLQLAHINVEYTIKPLAIQLKRPATFLKLQENAEMLRKIKKISLLPQKVSRNLKNLEYSHGLLLQGILAFSLMLVCCY